MVPFLLLHRHSARASSVGYQLFRGYIGNSPVSQPGPKSTFEVRSHHVWVGVLAPPVVSGRRTGSACRMLFVQTLEVHQCRCSPCKRYACPVGSCVVFGWEYSLKGFQLQLIALYRVEPQMCRALENTLARLSRFAGLVRKGGVGRGQTGVDQWYCMWGYGFCRSRAYFSVKLLSCSSARSISDLRAVWFN